MNNTLTLNKYQELNENVSLVLLFRLIILLNFLKELEIYAYISNIKFLYIKGQVDNKTHCTI